MPQPCAATSVLHTQKGACQTLAFARAVCASLQAEEDSFSKQIEEMEKYLRLLQTKRAMVQIKALEADEQLGMIKEALDSDGIPEAQLSDNESDYAASSPHSSDFVYADGSESESDLEPAYKSTTVYNTSEQAYTNGTILMNRFEGKGKQTGIKPHEHQTVLV